VIVVRDVLKIDPQHMKDVREQMLKMRELGKRLGYPAMRALTDLVSDYYTLVLESEFSDMGAYEKAMQSMLQNAEWQQAYGAIRPVVRGGKREVYTVLG